MEVIGCVIAVLILLLMVLFMAGLTMAITIGLKDGVFEDETGESQDDERTQDKDKEDGQ